MSVAHVSHLLPSLKGSPKLTSMDTDRKNLSKKTPRVRETLGSEKKDSFLEFQLTNLSVTKIAKCYKTRAVFSCCCDKIF